MTKRSGIVVGSAAIAAVFCATVVSLDRLGTSRRVSGPALALGRGVNVVEVERADEAYSAWKERRLHGRVVVSISSRLYFVAPVWRLPPRDPTGRPLDPSLALEHALTPQNFLLTSLERGVAREIRHVVPDRVFAAKVSGSLGEEGVHLSGENLAAPHRGSPRSLTTLEGFRAPGEPALLFVSASWFGERDAGALWRQLASSGLSTDLVVLCASRDDPEITEAQREQLARFAGLLRSS